MRMTSYDENGPLISRGTVAFSARAENLPGGKHVFELPVYMVASEESEVVVEYNGLRLRDLGTSNDYYGFGTSPRIALNDAAARIEQLSGINADIVVRSTITQRPCIIAEDAPFYYGAQRVHYIPMTWGHARKDLAEMKEDFVVWRNGEPTEDGMAWYDRIKDLVLSDSAPSRNGELRSIIAGKAARSRADFLIAT